MNIRVYPYAEDSRRYSRKLQKSLLANGFNRSTFLYVNFNVVGKRDIIQIQVFYSKEKGLFFSKFHTQDIIRFAFGKFEKFQFMLAKERNNPLQSFFTFDFSLKYEDEPYSAVFAEVNKSKRILSKIYDLTDEQIDLLRSSYNIYKLEGDDYCLLDFGSINNGEKFLKNLVNITEDLEFTLNSSNRLVIDKKSLESIKRRDENNSPYKYCMICGSRLEKTIHNALFDLSVRFPARCEECLKKIYALDLYYSLNDDFSSSDTISLSELEGMWDDDVLAYNLKLLTEYEFLNPFLDDIYKISPNEHIIKMYSPLLKPVEEESPDGGFGSVDKYLGIDDDDGDEIEDEKVCKICGNSFDFNESQYNSEICPDCLSKQNTIERLHTLIKYVKPGSIFTKDSLEEKGLKHLELEIIIGDLIENGLIVDNNDNYLYLESIPNLNEFIKSYSDNLDDDLITISDDSFPIQTISSEYMNEDSLDKGINLIDYQKYVECKHDRKSDKWVVIYKKDGYNLSLMKFETPFEAKMAAIRYLDEHNIIDVVSADEIRDPYFDNGINVLICPVCGKEFETKSMFSQKYCEECNNKYSQSEKMVLIGIHKGEFTNQTAKKVNKLLDKGKTKKDIAQKLKLKNPSLINAIIKYLLISDEDATNFGISSVKPIKSPTIKQGGSSTNKGQSEVNTGDKNTKICALCEKEFVVKGKFSSGQKYCDDCNSKYDTFEKQVLIGIKEGIYTEEMAIKIDELLKLGMSRTNIAIRKFKLKNTSLIGPILKFLLPDSKDKPEDIIELSNGSKGEEITDIQKVKHCAVCGNTFIEPKTVNNQKYCDDCKDKYKPSELKTLEGINNGLYNEEMAIEINDLLKQGLTKVAIGKKLGISDSLINPILKYLLPEGVKKADKPKVGGNKKIKTCLLCGEEFTVPKQVTQKYCDNCRNKYTVSEISTLMGIKDGKYNKDMAIEIHRLQKSGFSNKKIADQLGISSTIITPIIKFIPVSDEEIGDVKEIELEGTTKNCLICNEEFTMPKNVSSQKYCKTCSNKYNPVEQNVLAGINEGRLNENLAIRIDNYKKKGKSNQFIIDNLHVSPSVLGFLPKLLLPENNMEISEGILYNNVLEKYFVNVRDYSDQAFIGLFDREDEAIYERNKFLGVGGRDKDIKIPYGEELANPKGKGLEIIRNGYNWFVYNNGKLLDIFDNFEEANVYYNFYKISLSESNMDLNKQLFKNEDDLGANMVLKGVVSDDDRMSLLNFISSFDLNLNKFVCSKLDNDLYEVLVDFEIDKSNLRRVIINLKELGWS